jgi:hypothetical protein
MVMLIVLTASLSGVRIVVCLRFLPVRRIT